MNLEPTGIENAGEIDRERIVMRASADIDVAYFAVFSPGRNAQGKLLAGTVKDVYWFPPKKVKSGDWVVLYTKVGPISEKVTENGPTSHFFYWGKLKPMWGSGAIPVLVETPTWKNVPTVTAK